MKYQLAGYQRSQKGSSMLVAYDEKHNSSDNIKSLKKRKKEKQTIYKQIEDICKTRLYHLAQAK